MVGPWEGERERYEEGGMVGGKGGCAWCVIALLLHVNLYRVCANSPLHVLFSSVQSFIKRI